MIDRRRWQPRLYVTAGVGLGVFGVANALATGNRLMVAFTGVMLGATLTLAALVWWQRL